MVRRSAAVGGLRTPERRRVTSTGHLMQAVLGGLADLERDLIRTRTRRRQEPRQSPRKAYGAATLAERGHQTARAGRYVAGIGGQLRAQHIYHAPGDPRCQAG